MRINVGGREYVRMIPPSGSDTANHGGECFTIEDDGTMLVCAEAVEPLCRVAGYTIAPDAAPAPSASTWTPAPPVDPVFLAEVDAVLDAIGETGEHHHADAATVAAIVAEIEKTPQLSVASGAPSLMTLAIPT